MSNPQEPTADEFFQDKASVQARALYGAFSLAFYGSEDLPPPMLKAAKEVDSGKTVPADLLYAIRRLTADMMFATVNGDSEKSRACLEVSGKFLQAVPFGSFPPEITIPVILSMIVHAAGNIEHLLRNHPNGPASENEEGAPASLQQQAIKIIQEMSQDPNFQKEVEASGGKITVLTVPDPLSGTVIPIRCEADIPAHFGGERKSEIRACLAELEQAQGRSCRPFWGSLPPEGLGF